MAPTWSLAPEQREDVVARMSENLTRVRFFSKRVRRTSARIDAHSRQRAPPAAAELLTPPKELGLAAPRRGRLLRILPATMP